MPKVTEQGLCTLHDLEPTPDDLHLEVLRGLSKPIKTLPCKLFYDEEGSRLFDRICELDAYYLTRTETAILERHASEMAAAIGPDCRVVELGSGSSSKTQIVLDHLERPVAYVPIDISRAHLIHASLMLAERYPTIEVLPVCADYTRELWVPSPKRQHARTVAFFPGSTIGNFEPADAEAFLHRIAALCGPGGGLLIGLDLKKDAGVIEGAYNDPEEVTAAFNRNVLVRINRECGTDFDPTRFEHLAFFNPAEGRIEMHLVSQESQRVRLPGRSGEDETVIPFRAGEHIVTEYSYKYSLEEFRKLAERAGFRVERVWTDEQQLFSVQYLSC